MGVYRRPDSTFYWMRLEGTNRRVCTKIPVGGKAQREAAEAVYRATMTALAKEDLGLPTGMSGGTLTLLEFSRWYETNILPKHRGQERELEILAILRSHLGALDLRDITRATVQEYQAVRLKAKKAPGTVNREVAVLKAIIREAVTAGHLAASPLAGMPMLRMVRRDPRTLSAADEVRLLEQLPHDLRVLYIVAVDTLARLSNVLNLTREEDRGTHLALVDSKTGPYEVPLSSRARAALDSLPKTDAYYFPDRRKAKAERDRRMAIRSALRRACARCTPPIPFGRAAGGITFHGATRATGATRMLRAQVDPRTVQKIGNWASFTTMGRYLAAGDMDVRAKAVELIAPGAVTPPSRDDEPKPQAPPDQRDTAS